MQIKLRTILIFTCSIVWLPTIYANSHFEEKFQALVKSSIPTANIGMVVQDPKSGSVLFQSRANDLFCPASNTKILTSIAALKFFGPNFQYQTSLHTYLENIKENTLKDNLYIIFRGDPTLSSADLFNMLSHLKTKGIKQIEGNIIIDDKAFEDPAYAPGWTWDSINWYYSAPITSIILNENKVRFKIPKSEMLYDQIKIEQEDKNIPLQRFKSDVTAVTFDESEHECRLNATVKNNDISLTGCWPEEKTPTFIELALDNPQKLAQELIIADLKKLGITLTGKISFASAPKDVPAIATKHSQPLKLLLYKVLADSNNIYAESLTKALGLVYLGEGSFQTGTRAIQTILDKETKTELSKLPLSDGSGQSRYNLISPLIIVQLLNHMYHDPNFSVFYKALSVNGKSGTLAARMKTKELTGKVVAKTGSVTGISALSGYFTANNGKEYIFSVLINHSDKNSYSLKAFEDKLCKLLIEENWQS